MHVSLHLVLLFLLCSSYGSSTPVPETNNSREAARIVNGYEVAVGEVPYQASLRKKVVSGWAHFCGAVIISERAILTAAHCVISYLSSPSSLKVTVGSVSRFSGGKNYDIYQVIIHEEYSTTTLEHDIALLVTAKSITFSQLIQPIATADENIDLSMGTEALVSGFGTTSYEGSSSSVLLAARVNIVAQETCARAYLRIASITEGMLCATGYSPPRDACQGDSGGPLAAKNHLVGIVSWGEGCADFNYPGVYTRVSQYYDWIWQRVKAIQ